MEISRNILDHLPKIYMIFGVLRFSWDFLYAFLLGNLLKKVIILIKVSIAYNRVLPFLSCVGNVLLEIN